MFQPEYIVIHHTAGPNTRSHFDQVVKDKKYHLVVFDSKQPYQKPIFAVSVPNDQPTTFAVGGYNSKSFSIAVVGNYNEIHPSPLLLWTLVQILVFKCLAFDISPDKIISHGQLANLKKLGYSTACCGTHLQNKLKTLQNDVKKYLRP